MGYNKEKDRCFGTAYKCASRSDKKKKQCQHPTIHPRRSRKAGARSIFALLTWVCLEQTQVKAVRLMQVSIQMFYNDQVRDVANSKAKARDVGSSRFFHSDP